MAVLQAAPSETLQSKVLRKTACAVHVQTGTGGGADVADKKARKKHARRLFKETLLDLIDVDKITLDEEGAVSLTEAGKVAEEKRQQRSRKRAREEAEAQASGAEGGGGSESADEASEAEAAPTRWRAADSDEDNGTTSAAAVSVPAAPASRVRVSFVHPVAGDVPESNVWNSRMHVKPPTQPRRKHKSRSERKTAAARAAVFPVVELLRLRKARSLRSKLTRLCSKHKLRMPVLAFERWLSRCKLHERWAGEQNCDPLLPSTGWRDKGLVKDLKRVLASEEVALEISAALSEKASAASEELHAAHTASMVVAEQVPKQEESGDEATTKHVVIAETDHGFTLSLGEGGKPYMSINRDHFAKLRTLYERHSLDGAELDGQDVVQEFLERVFCLLVRYEALKGHGYQAAVAGNVFDMLLDKLDVSMECFASPLNARYDAYCSAFADTDGPFGSVGSFFDFTPSQGSFQANPPFVPELMTEMVLHMEELLRTAAGPMSFVIFMPAWRMVAAWKQLDKSSYRRARTVIRANNHGYCDGAQHLRKDRYEPPPPIMVCCCNGV